MSSIEAGAAFVMGVLGSTHCVSMCGPLSIVLTSAPKRRLPMIDERPSLPIARKLTVHAGRITTYSILGALAGGVGSTVRDTTSLGIVQLSTRVFAALVLLGAGLYVAGLFSRFRAIEKLFVPLHRWLSPRVGARTHDNLVGQYSRGLVWGLLPCGLVAGGLALAMVSSSPASGALTMLAFGLGTWPALVAVDLFATAFRRAMQNPWLRRAAGLLILLSGVTQASLAIAESRALIEGRAERPCCAARHAREAQASSATE